MKSNMKEQIVYPRALPDVVWVDRKRAALFEAVGRTRSPFHDASRWPDLNALVAQRSREVQQEKGLEGWAAAGGRDDERGVPTFSGNAADAGRIVEELAANSGGFLWSDTEGARWAVRLVSVDGAPGGYFGFGVSWAGLGASLAPPTDDETVRRRVETATRRLWLYERAEQALWLTHSAVLAQRSQVVLLPDVLLGQAFWGTGTWPTNWRQDIRRVLTSLMALHTSVLRIQNWQPRFGAQAVAIASVAHLEALDREQQHCRPACPMFSDSRHEHFQVEVPMGFLGVLERFAKVDAAGVRSYDFTGKLQGDDAKMLKAAKRSGQIVSVHVPTAVFGPASWSGLTTEQRRIVQALVREVTRRPGKARPGQPAQAEVIVGNVVVGARGRGTVACPLLEPTGRYTSFNGNGCLRGQGYRLYGASDRGWLAKCGYAIEAGET